MCDCWNQMKHIDNDDDDDDSNIKYKKCLWFSRYACSWYIKKVLRISTLPKRDIIIDDRPTFFSAFDNLEGSSA